MRELTRFLGGKAALLTLTLGCNTTDSPSKPAAKELQVSVADVQRLEKEVSELERKKTEHNIALAKAQAPEVRERHSEALETIESELRESRHRLLAARGRRTELSLTSELHQAKSDDERKRIKAQLETVKPRPSSLKSCLDGASCPEGELCNLDVRCKPGGACSEPRGDGRCYRSCEELGRCVPPEECSTASRCGGSDVCSTVRVCRRP